MWWFVAQALAAEDAPQHREARDAVRAAIAGRTGANIDDVEVRNLGLPDTAPAHGRWEVQLQPSGPYCGGVPLRLVAFGDQGAVFRYNLRPQVTIWVTAPLAGRSAGPGEPVEIVMGRVPLETLRGEDPVDPAAIWQARVTLSAGDPVTMQRARPVPDAAEGAVVTVVAGRGQVEVQAPGRLDEDAYVGRPVRVINLATHRVLTGTYHAGGLVHVGAP